MQHISDLVSDNVLNGHQNRHESGDSFCKGIEKYLVKDWEELKDFGSPYEYLPIKEPLV